jgi:uncharacterized membrane protein YidH (DUF202 family)
MKIEKVLFPIFFFILFCLILVFLSSYNIISKDVSFGIAWLALLWSLFTFILEIVNLIRKTENSSSFIHKSRKISASLIVIPGVILAVYGLLYYLDSWLGIMKSPNRAYLPLFLPFTLPALIFAVIISVLFIILIVKIFKRLSNKNKSTKNFN